MRNRKSQITVFMILGIILLFSTALIFYIKGRVQIPEEELLPRLEEIPDVLKPVRQFVEGCASQKLDEGLIRAMQHGGLIYTDDLFIDITDPTEGEGVELIPDSGINVPYWSYMESDNDCTAGCVMNTKMPPLCKRGRIGCITQGDGSVEEELRRYLEEEMKNCIMDFRDLRRQGYNITELGNLTAQVNIREKDAVALIDYELEIEKAEAKTRIRDYYATDPTKISKMFDIAIQIINYTTDTCLYEKYTLDLIAAYSGLEKENLPPLAEITFGEKKKTWSVLQSQEQLDNVMVNMVSLLRVYNSSNEDLPEINETGEYRRTRQAVFDRTMYFPLKQYEDVEIHSYYMPWWESYLDITPKQGDSVGPSTELGRTSGDLIETVLTILSYKEYFSTYRYSYPIVTELMFENDIGEKRVFRYAQEVNLRGRSCVKPSTKMLSSPATGVQTILCDEDMREEQNTTIRVYDEFNKTKTLEGVEIYFDVGEQCFLGVTDEEGKIITNMPRAYGYFLTFSKDGYLRRIIHEKDITKPIKIYLSPIMSKKIRVLTINDTVVENIKTAKTTLEAYNWVRNSSQALLATDKLMIKVERVQETYQDPEFKKVATYDEETYQPEEIELTTGTFSVDIKVMDRRNFTIPRELDRICEEGTGGSCVKTPVDPDCSPRGDSEDDFREGDCWKEGYTCENAEDARDKNSESEDDDYEACVIAWLTGFGFLNCYRKSCDEDKLVEYNESNVTNILIGGVILDNTTKYYKITDPEQITDTEEIIFYVFRQPIPTRHHHLEKINEYEEWSRSYASYVMPRLR